MSIPIKSDWFTPSPWLILPTLYSVTTIHPIIRHWRRGSLTNERGTSRNIQPARWLWIQHQVFESSVRSQVEFRLHVSVGYAVNLNTMNCCTCTGIITGLPTSWHFISRQSWSGSRSPWPGLLRAKVLNGRLAQLHHSFIMLLLELILVNYSSFKIYYSVSCQSIQPRDTF